MDTYQRFKSIFELEVRIKTDPAFESSSCSVASSQNTSPEATPFPGCLMFNERLLFLPLGSTTVLSMLIRGFIKNLDVSRRNEPS